MCDFTSVPKKYIDHMITTYISLFGSKPLTEYNFLFEKADHPETDDSEFLDANGTQQYQSLISALQWAVTISHFDIITAMMTFSSF